MNSFTLTQSAKTDLKEVARFTEKNWGRTQRNIYIKQFDDMFHRLADTPSIGQKCDYIKSNYQKFPQGSHIIFYKKVSNESIQIIRILHKSMDTILQLDNS